MSLRYLSASDLERALPMDAAVESARDAFRALASADVPLRTAVRSETGVTLLMGACAAGLGLAAKVVSVFPGNAARGQRVVQGLALVLDPESGAPLAVCDGAALTALRTGAASGAATDALARPEARVGCVIGCGVQARTQALAIDCVRELEELRVVGRNRARVRAFAEALGAEVRARVVVASDVDAGVDGADVICLATSAREPVLDGERLAPGAHVNGVGSFTLEMREADPATVRRARVFVDCVESALAEAGELVAAEREGLTRRTDWTELGAVLAGRAQGRRSAEEVTFFKSVGHAVQDVAAGARALARARELDLGTVLEPTRAGEGSR